MRPAGPTDDAVTTRERRLPAVARSVGAARHWLADQPLGGVSLRNAQLVLSELVTNSIVHAGLVEGRDEIVVTVRVTATGVRIEVADPGAGFPAGALDPGDGGPRRRASGLTIVERLVDRWGVEGGSVTRVWFEMDRR